MFLPIFLISVLSKGLETVVLNRLMAMLEPQLIERQYAYRRSRGTEQHLSDFSDFVREMPLANRSVYIASIDVDGAFDTVPHVQLMRTIDEMGVDTYTRRYLATWLAHRRFSVRLATPQGRYYSSWRRLSRGSPQGGVLSPFYGFFTSIRSCRELRGPE